VEPEQLKNRL